MNDFLIEFNKLDWEQPQKGIKQKSYTKGTTRIRLVRFNDEFKEKDWCTKGHIGFVIKGNLRVEFDKETIIFKEGNALWISEGVKYKHKVKMEKMKTAELILFEKIL